MVSTQPTKLGRYEVLEELGKGAMGVVYLARDPLIGRRVAIKTFRFNWATGPREIEQARARFIREAQNAGILSHPSIVTVHDVVEESEEGVSFIAMEYVPGTSLKELLAKQKPLEHDFVVDLISQVAGALDYAHGRGVIHRDIKPGNILISLDHRVKIADFGIARGPVEDITNLTGDGQIVGTPNYMSPEQVLGKELDHRADIFSLGVVLYETLTLRKPFLGDNAAVVTHRIAYDPHEPPSKIVADLPEKVDEILGIALEKEPSRRYARAGDLGEELRRALPGDGSLGDSADTQEVPELVVDESVFEDSPEPPPQSRPARTAPAAGMPAWSWRRPAIGLGIAVLWSMAALGSGALWLAGGGGPPLEEPPFQETYARLLATGQARLLEGKPEEAVTLFAMAAEGAPAEWTWTARVVSEARRQAAVAASLAEAQSRRLDILAAARQALEAGDAEEALRLAGVVLVEWPGDLEASRLVSELGGPEVEEPEPPVRVAEARPLPAPSRSPPSRPEPAPPAAQPAPQVRPEPQPAPVATDVDLAIDFLTELPEGVLTIYANERRILREPFHFYKRSGVLGLRREPSSGRVEARLSQPVGEVIFRIYITLPGHPTLVETVETSLDPGMAPTLRIILWEGRRVEVRIG